MFNDDEEKKDPADEAGRGSNMTTTDTQNPEGPATNEAGKNQLINEGSQPDNAEAKTPEELANESAEHEGSDVLAKDEDAELEPDSEELDGDGDGDVVPDGE